MSKSKKTIIYASIIALIILLIGLLIVPKFLKEKIDTIKTGILDISKEQNTYEISLNGNTHKITYQYSKIENKNKENSEITTAVISMDDKEISTAKIMVNYKEDKNENTAKIKPTVYKNDDNEYLILEIDNISYLDKAGKTVIIISEEGKVLKTLSSKTEITELTSGPKEYLGKGNAFKISSDSIKFIEVNKDTVSQNIKEFYEYELIIEKDRVIRKRLGTYKAKTTGNLGKVW